MQLLFAGRSFLCLFLVLLLLVPCARSQAFSMVSYIDWLGGALLGGVVFGAFVGSALGLMRR